jgi:DNA-binding beta-propeller fold protein YncE
VYLGYGEEDTGAIAVIDANTARRLNDFKVGAHPESFQLENSGSRIFVNLPDSKEIAVVNRETHEVKKWRMTVGGNFPMALD